MHGTMKASPPWTEHVLGVFLCVLSFVAAHEARRLGMPQKWDAAILGILLPFYAVVVIRRNSWSRHTFWTTLIACFAVNLLLIGIFFGFQVRFWGFCMGLHGDDRNFAIEPKVGQFKPEDADKAQLLLLCCRRFAPLVRWIHQPSGCFSENRASPIIEYELRNVANAFCATKFPSIEDLQELVGLRGELNKLRFHPPLIGPRGFIPNPRRIPSIRSGSRSKIGQVEFYSP
ncbi:MAG: hypothetical protein WCD57_10060 [Acidobacteriaceae bacterium]